MFFSWLTLLTAGCVRRPWRVVLLAAALTAGAGWYAGTRFKIDTNTDRLMPGSLPWVQREHAYEAAFPQPQIVAVVEAPTPELAGDAARRLADALGDQKRWIRAVEQPQGSDYAARSGLLFQPLPEVQQLVGGLEQGRPVLQALAADPTLRGAMQTFAGLARSDPAAATRPADMLAGTLEDSFAGRFASFSWLALLQGRPPDAGERRQILLITPVLNFGALQPGALATAAIRAAADRARIVQEDGASLHLTGPAPINDAQFATLSKGAAINEIGTALVVLLILWLALRSARIVLAVVLNLIAGLVITAACGLLLVGAFNIISVAFAVLFVGLGADFGLQYGVRYRAERHETDDIPASLRGATEKAGGALALAAAGVAAGFFCFVPTDYRGISELGQVAGFGMLIAFLLTLTLLPALLTVLKPGFEPKPLGYAFLAPVDRFLGRHRIAVVICTLVPVLAASPLLAYLSFDFDPNHLQDPTAEAVRTYGELGHDPASGVAAVNVAAPDLGAAQALAQRLTALPEVAGIRTVANLIPPDQAPKIAAIEAAAPPVLQALDPPGTRPPPNDDETVAAIRAAADALPDGDAATRLRPLLLRLALSSPDQREAAAAAIERPLALDLDRLRATLRPAPVSVASLPPDLRREFLAPDGRARVQVLPKGDPDDTAAMARFARAVLALTPDASGTAITLYQSGRTVVRAFIEAGLLAVAAIAVILLIALRRVSDVLLTLVPLLVAAAVTLEITVLIGQKLNFANIIAMPLLLGVGVAFKIYYILAWRRGATNLLQSTLTRAVFFSALTTMTAFGSLWLSNQPGMSSMGKMMALALVCTLFAAVLFQPALMGAPRTKGQQAPSRHAERS